MSTQQRNFGLDALRASAILLVIISHGSKFFPDSWTSGYKDAYWSLGVIGVELFYALSGFLIGGLLLDMQSNGVSLKHIGIFMSRRWMRTLPLYYLILATLFFIPALDPEQRYGVGNYLVMTQNFLHPMFGNWFGPSWSLTIEEWSYIALPLLAFVLMRGVPQPVATAALLLIAAGFVWRLIFTSAFGPWDETVRKVVLTRTDAIAYGVLVACAMRLYGKEIVWKWSLRLFPINLAIIVSTIFICAYRTYDARLLQGLYGRVVMFGLLGASLAMPLPLVLGFPSRSPIEKPTRFIAKISYALYLVHWPFLFVCEAAPAPYQFLLFISATFVTSTVISYGIEQPLLRLRPSMPIKTINIH